LKKISVIGGGSWATAIVKMFVENKTHVSWYLRKKENVVAVSSTGRNPNYLSFLSLPLDLLHVSDDINEIINSSNTIIFAVPSAYLAALTDLIDPDILKEKNIITSIKGTVGEYNMLPSIYLSNKFDVPSSRQAIIAGPCHAEEIAMGRKTYVTIASENAAFAYELSNAISTSYIHAQTSSDLIGIEYAGVYKNIIGIACGIAKGLNYGDNFQAVLVSNAIYELDTFLKAVHKPAHQPAASAYLGDLLVTAYSNFSRNRAFGEMIGRGYSVLMAKEQMTMVAEGYYASKGIFAITAKQAIQAPIVSAVYRILHNHLSPYSAFKLLENQLQ
jgi:glycerol-3-phosphate dehydrogenase (NAD(P)+)